MERSFVSPPKNRDPLNPPPRKRGTYDSAKVNELLKGKVYKGIKIQKNPQNFQKNGQAPIPFTREIIFLTAFIIYFIRLNFISKETVNSCGIALIDETMKNVANMTHIPETIMKPFFASIFSASFFSFSSVFSQTSFVPFITTVFLTLDTKLTNMLLSSYGFSLAASFSMLSMLYSTKSIISQTSATAYVLNIFAATFFASAAIVFKYELQILFFISLISIMTLITKSKGSNASEKAFAVFSFIIIFVVSIVVLFVIDSRTQIIEISFDIPLWKDGISTILQMDSNGFSLISIIFGFFMVFTSKFNISECIAIGAFVILAIIAQIFPVSVNPDLTMRSIVIRISLIGLSSAILSRNENIGLVLSCVAGIYEIVGSFISLPNKLLMKLL